MFENDDLNKANRMPPLVWAVIAGLITLGVLANISTNDYVPLIGSIIAGVFVYHITKPQSKDEV